MPYTGNLCKVLTPHMPERLGVCPHVRSCVCPMKSSDSKVVSCLRCSQRRRKGTASQEEWRTKGRKSSAGGESQRAQCGDHGEAFNLGPVLVLQMITLLLSPLTPGLFFPLGSWYLFGFKTQILSDGIRPFQLRDPSPAHFLPGHVPLFFSWFAGTNASQERADAIQQSRSNVRSENRKFHQAGEELMTQTSTRMRTVLRAGKLCCYRKGQTAE